MQFLAAHAFHFQAERDVLQGGEPRQKFGVLEYDAAVVAAAFHDHAVDRHRAAGRGLESHGDAQGGGLAAAGRPDQRDDLAVGDGEAQTVQRPHRLHLAVDAQCEAFRYVG